MASARISSGTSVHTAEALTPEQVRMYAAGFWIFMVSEAIIFITLFGVRFLLAGTTVLPTNRIIPIATTVLLLASGYTSSVSSRAAAQGENVRLRQYVRLTSLLALLSLISVAIGWATAGLDPAKQYGGIFYTIIGYHAFHELVGLFLFVSLLIRTRRIAYTPQNHLAVQGTVWFWEFLIVVWILAYIILYFI